MITRADKENSLVILPTTQYESKIEEFIQKINFQTSMINPTKSFQSQVRKVINYSITAIPSYTKRKHNPTALSIKGLNELHKRDTTDRPVVNWREAPGHKLARLFTKENQTDGPVTQHIQPREHQRRNQETWRHSGTP
jgi:hypothetical protein